MPTDELNLQKQIFAKNLRHYLSIADKTQTDLQKYMNVSSSTVSDWIHGAKMPRMDKIQSICNWLNIQKSDLLEEKTDKQLQDGYYYNDESMKIAQDVYQNPDLHMLFDMARDAKPEEIKDFVQVIALMKKRERYED